jgi:sulfotransferase family protein
MVGGPLPLPNYIHVGQGKAGSTALHYALEQNPEICLVKTKEAHFFDSDESFEKGPEFYAATYFSHWSGQKVVGDITPAYVFPETLARIAKTLGSAVKITVCFRHPVARAFSHYFHDVRLLNKPGRLMDRLKRGEPYVEAGMGGRTLQALYELFPRENILPLIYERDVRRLDVTYRRVCEFLGVKAHHIDLKHTAGIGFVPRVKLAKFWGVARDYRGFHYYRPSDIVIETLHHAKTYEANVIKSPSRDERRHYLGLFDGITWRLDDAEIEAIYHQVFAEDVDLLKSLLQDSIPEWDAIRQLKAPPLRRSRLGVVASIRNLKSELKRKARDATRTDGE